MWIAIVVVIVILLIVAAYFMMRSSKTTSNTTASSSKTSSAASSSKTASSGKTAASQSTSSQSASSQSAPVQSGVTKMFLVNGAGYWALRQQGKIPILTSVPATTTPVTSFSFAGGQYEQGIAIPIFLQSWGPDDQVGNLTVYSNLVGIQIAEFAQTVLCNAATWTGSIITANNAGGYPTTMTKNNGQVTVTIGNPGQQVTATLPNLQFCKSTYAVSL